METVKKYRLHNIIQTLIMIGIGRVLVAWPGASLDVMARALAALLVLIGAIFVVAYFFKKDKTFVSYTEFAVGIVVAAIGAWIYINPGFFTDFIPKLFGIFIVVSGLTNLGQTFSLIKYRFKGWWASFLIAALTVGLGAFLLFKTDVVKDMLVVIIGVFLIIDGVTNLLNLILLIIAEKQKEANEAPIDAEAVVENVEEASEETSGESSEVVDVAVVEEENKEEE